MRRVAASAGTTRRCVVGMGRCGYATSTLKVPIEPKRLAGKVALITGATNGIGREASILFARHGARVVAVDLGPADETLEVIKAEGGEVVYVKADVSKAEDCENMVRVAEKTYGKLNVLFNNAGIIHGDDNAAHDTEERVWDLTMNVNAKGVFLGCKYGIPAIRRAGGG